MSEWHALAIVGLAIFLFMWVFFILIKILIKPASINIDAGGEKKKLKAGSGDE